MLAVLSSMAPSHLHLNEQLQQQFLRLCSRYLVHWHMATAYTHWPARPQYGISMFIGSCLLTSATMSELWSVIVMNTVCIKLLSILPVHTCSNSCPGKPSVSYHVVYNLFIVNSLSHTLHYVCVVCKLLGLCVGWIDRHVRIYCEVHCITLTTCVVSAAVNSEELWTWPGTGPIILERWTTQSCLNIAGTKTRHVTVFTTFCNRTQKTITGYNSAVDVAT